MRLPRVAVVSDLREERWHAMDLVAEMLLLNLRTPERATRRCNRAASGDGAASHSAAARRNNGDRGHCGSDPQPRLGLPAMASLPGRRLRSLPHHRPQLRASGDSGCRRAGRSSPATIWTPFAACSPGLDGGSIVERALGRRLLAGMRAARKILCGSAATRDELVSAAAIPAERVVVVPNGVHPACSPRPDPGADREAASLLGPAGGHRVELLHVGSTIPRKRIDVLLNVVAALRGRIRAFG